jgi:hypothetical protein
MASASTSSNSQGLKKSWFLKFMRSPIKIEKSQDDKLHLCLEVNKFEPGSKEKIVGTGKTEIDVCDVVFRSVGYKGKRIFAELPFNEETGIIPNVGGKIQDGK